MCGLASCGDNSLPIGAPLTHARDLAIVAHAEDDLVFMQPDLLERMLGGGVMNVYVTDGDSPALEHEGLLHAYSAATGHEGWSCGWIDVLETPVEHCRLEDAHLSLIFLGYPAADVLGVELTSLTHLWSGEIASATTIGARPVRFTRGLLIDTLRGLITVTEPRTVRTLDFASTHGPEHSDHTITGAATLLAIARAKQTPALISYRGESTGRERANVSVPLFTRSAALLGFFTACAEGCAVCGERCDDVGPARAVWMQRRYAIATRRIAGGALRTPDGRCVDDRLRVASCAAAPRWELAADGALRTGERCLGFDSETNALVAGTEEACARFFFDDEGHLFIGTVPAAVPGGPLLCLSVFDSSEAPAEAGQGREALLIDSSEAPAEAGQGRESLLIDVGDRVHAGRCGGKAGAATWELAPMPTTTATPAGLTRTGRAVRLADLDGDRRADLCAVEGNVLRCAPGDGAGGFGASRPVHALGVEPESLVLGDVDGDGLADACGRDGGGLVCATALTGFVPERWSNAFARTGAADASDHSLAAVDADADGAAEICGLSDRGVTCADHDVTGLPEVRSTWPGRAALLWPADLDGDRRADWCTAVDGTVACGLDLYRPITRDGSPWSFSQSGVVDATPSSAALSGMADVDGDGAADLCGVRVAADAVRVTCARSQGFGFGPSLTLGVFPAGLDARGLWLGDLDGDGHADACLHDGAAVSCVRSP
jgi:hypothetical protein